MKEKIKIQGKAGLAVIIALGIGLAAFACGLILGSDEPYDNPAPNPIGNLNLVNINEITPDDDGYRYDDGDTELILTPIDESTLEKEVGEGDKVISGESGGKSWTSVIDPDGNESIYIKLGDDTVKAKVVNKPADHGVEKSASKAAALVQKKAAYSSKRVDYDENYATHYIEFADCILYYPAQLTKKKVFENNTLELADQRSSAVLRITYEENPYTSMDELEGLIENSENDTLLAYGPAWYTAETFEGDNTVYTYVGLGDKYIINAELRYESKYGFVFEQLRRLIKCKFIGDGIWVSEQKAENYYDETKLFNSKFSTEITSYYSKELKAILLYPEMFSIKGDTAENCYITFLDPLSGATLDLSELDDDVTMKSFNEMSAYTDVNAVSENAVVAQNPENGIYSYAYFGSRHVMATVYYPWEFAWVYEQLLSEIKVIPAENFYDNTEMQDIVYDDVGCRITIPLQFEELGFYDNVATFEDSNTGITLSVSFGSITDNIQKTDIFSCFEVVAEDGDVRVGENHVSWMNNMGFSYGARGNYSTALLEIHAPNAPTVYRSTLPLIGVEFISEIERIPTEEEEILENENPPETEPVIETDEPETEPVIETDEPVTEKPETRPIERPVEREPAVKEEKPLPLIMTAGLGDLVSDPKSPLIDLLMNIDANQITKGDLNIFRLIGYGDDISDEDIDLIMATTEELVELGFVTYSLETGYYRTYIFNGELNDQAYVIGFTFEYTDETFSFVDGDFVYDGPGERLYMTILTKDPQPDPGDIILGFDFLALDGEGFAEFDFESLYSTAWAQRVVAQELKRSGEFDEQLVFLINRINLVYDEDSEDYYIEYTDDASYDELLIGYGVYNSLGSFKPYGRYIYNAQQTPAPVADDGTSEYERDYSRGRYDDIWAPDEYVGEIYDFWSEKAEIDSFFDELEAELFADYPDYLR